MSVSMQESAVKQALLPPGDLSPGASMLPAPIVAAGPAAVVAWDEFFIGQLPNRHTRTAYLAAARRFLAWIEPHQPELARITPGLVGEYFNGLKLSIPSKKLHLAALRSFFDTLVQRHVMVINPALSVRTERFSVVEGRTPEITVEQARQLLASIATDSLLGLRDRAVIATLVYTAARAGAVAKLRLADFVHDGTQYLLRFAEKGGKARTIPVQHKLEQFIREYSTAAALEGRFGDEPLFRSISGVGRRLSDRAISGVDICRMVKRRLKAAGLPTGISPHSFRSCAATDLLLNGVALEDVQYLLGHADARTTRLYDRRQKQVTRNVVERISV